LILSFVGEENSGNQHLSLHISKMLSNIGKKVLLLSSSKKPLNFFGIDKRLVSNRPLEIYGFDVLIGTIGEDEELLNDYDYVIVSTNSSSVAGKIFLVQNCFDIVSLTRNKELIRDISGKVNLEDKNINVIYNNYIKTKATLAFLDRELNVAGKKIKIPFDIKNLKEKINEEVDQKINLKRFSQEYLFALIDILMVADNEFKPSQKDFKKMIR
jgi:hypothetical protein